MQNYINMSTNLLGLFNFIGEKKSIGHIKEVKYSAGGTTIGECGPKSLIVVDAPYELNTSLQIPILDDITTIGGVVEYEVLWPTHLIILRTHPTQVQYFYLFTYNLMSIICVTTKHKGILNLMFFYRKSRN